MSSLRRGVALIVFAPFVAIVVRPLSAVLLSYELLPRCSRRCFFSPRRRSKPSVESSGYCSWKFEALREEELKILKLDRDKMEKNEIEAALETSRKSLAANVLSSASQMSDPSKSFPEKEEVMELARKVFKDGRDVDLEDQVISDQFQIGYSSSRSSHFRSIPDCRYFSFICVSITGLKTCMTSGYSYIEGIEHLLLSLKQNNYEMHAFTNYPIWYQLIEDKLELSKYLSWTFCSCTYGKRKPDTEFFMEALEHLKVDPANCIFVDDRKKNVEAAIEVGIKGVHFKSVDLLCEELSLMGIEITADADHQ